ncbi:sensor histidine kinase [Baekduia soli]|uniref:histidine kinase n=1 Tax=Baekduia soli TaxID=496014 RepID=A0A5B8U4R5_9ACTN|nr:sensor histidine kinase [Baekduia soli]QEC47642.1 sensor histidine kinase [Baekduia soli]
MLRRILTLPMTATPWVDLTYLTLGLVSGCASLTLVFAGPVTGVLLLITLVGFVKLYADAWVVRWWANLERRRGALAGVPIPLSRRTWQGRNLPARLAAALRDPMLWRELVWAVVLFAFGLGAFCVGVIAWSVALALITAPAWAWSVSGGVDFGAFTADRTWEQIAIGVLAGPPAVVAAAWTVRGCALAEALLAQALLRGDEQERITELQVSRAGAVDAAAVELRRIERDLHDGAQARLVALAMDLGLARERLDSDPDGAARLLEGAHEDAKTALVELRDLARGIHPAILADRGLDAAVSALAARCPVPCTVAMDVPQRLPAAVESAAYFTVAEALTNVAKHSGAHRCEVAGTLAGGRLVVEVRDDGRGDADARRGTGIAGLRGRVEALDGRLTVTGAPGRGTVLRAELPCAS